MARNARSPRSAAAPEAANSGADRLQKVLAAAGLGSRRQCEELILTGRVEVDRKVVTALGTKADPTHQDIRVDGTSLPRPKLVHYMVYKPPGILSTNSDPAGRPRVIDLLPPRGERLFTVGRLDMSSEGLMLVTNDGELANRLAHPRYGIEKTYNVEVAGTIEREDLDKLRRGVHLAEGFARVVGARIKTYLKKSTLLEMVLDEGRNREIRRLLARVGHKVLRLKRVALGPLRLGELPSGAFRPLTSDELKSLWQATTPEARQAREQARRKPDPRKPNRPAAAKADAAKTDTAKADPAKPHGARAASAPVPKTISASVSKPMIVPRRPTIIGGDELAPTKAVPAKAAPTKAATPSRPGRAAAGAAPRSTTGTPRKVFRPTAGKRGKSVAGSGKIPRPASKPKAKPARPAGATGGQGRRPAAATGGRPRRPPTTGGRREKRG